MAYGTLAVDYVLYTSNNVDTVATVSSFFNGEFLNLSVTGSSVPQNGLYLSSANNLSISTSGTQRLLIDASGQIESASLGTASAPAWSYVGDPNTGIYSPGADQLAISTSGTGRVFIDSSGRLLLNTSTARANFFNQASGFETIFQIEGTGYSGSTASFTRNSNDTAAPYLVLGKTRGTSNGSNTIVSSGDELGNISFQGADGNELVQAASIITAVDGTPGANDMPGRLVFSTTADGSSSPTERLRIDSAGRVGIGTNSAGTRLHVSGTQGDNSTLYITSTDLAANNGGIISIGGAYDGSGNTTAFTQIKALKDNATVGDYGGSLAFFNRAGAGGLTEKARIDSSGRLLVGTSSATSGLPSGTIQVGTGQSAITNTGSAVPISILIPGSIEFNLDGVSGTQRHGRISGNGDTSGGAYAGGLDFEYYADKGSGYQWYKGIRITSGGTVLVGGTTDSGGAIAAALQPNGGVRGVTGSATCFYANRRTDDGNLVEFYQADTLEGTISVSGTTVSYNGAHLSRYSQLSGGTERTEILRGTVLSNMDEMCEWGNEDNEQLNRMKVSDVDDDPNVAGVFQAWDDDDDTYTDDFYCAMTGDFIIRIAEGVTVQRGDLLVSAGNGTARPQGDRYIKDSTVAKVTSTHVTCTYDDGSYCVPCVLMAC
jgi:hypothetical protein